MAVAVQPGAAAFAAGRPEALFATRIRRSTLQGASPYDVSADGERFLVDASQEDPAAVSPLHLVLGAFPGG
jgi:hypothetical protein